MNMLSALYCETIKVVRSLVFVLSFVFFAVAFGIMLLGIEQRTWTVFFETFIAMSANAGLLVNFFVAAWVFGREFTDKTNKDLCAKPMSRTRVVSSKFIIIFLWCFVFMLFLPLFNLALGFMLGFTGFTTALLSEVLPKFIVTSLLYIIICPTGAFFASISRGILAPIGILFIIAIAANIIGHSEAAPYFPWTIPNVFHETGRLGFVSIVILITVGIAGIAGTLAWWRFAEQNS